MDAQERQLPDAQDIIAIHGRAERCQAKGQNQPQYEGLQKLYTDNKDKGLVVLAFPSNDFGNQEPGSASEIKSFCESKYNVTFPIFDKIVVSRADATSVV